MSKSSRKYQPNKRKGSKPVLTRRTPKNQKKWNSKVSYATRMLFRKFYFANV